MSVLSLESTDLAAVEVINVYQDVLFFSTIRPFTTSIIIPIYSTFANHLINYIALHLHHKMRCSIAITTLLCLPALISAWSDSLYVRHADPDTDLYGTSLYARDASPYEGLDTSGAYHVKRAVEARYAKAEALAEAYAEAVDNAHELFSRAASAFPEAFPYPGKFKVPKDKAACTALRSKLTKEYHANEEEFGRLKAAYKDDNSQKAAELEKLAAAYVATLLFLPL